MDLDTNDSFDYLYYNWRIIGIYPYEKLKWLYNIYAIIINLAASVSLPVSVFANIFILGDIGLIMHNLQASLTLIVATMKQFVIFLRLSDLQSVRPYLNKLDQRARLNEEEVLYLRNVVKQCRIISLGVEIAFVFSLLSFAVPGLIKKRLVLEGWFPLDWTASMTNYLIAFGYQFMSAVFQIIQNSANDAYPPAYINLLNGQLHVLCMRVARIGKDPNATFDENFNELKACVNDHKNIISLFETIKSVISQTVMMQFIITAFVLCVSGVHFLFNREFGQLISTIVYTAAVLTESFPVCYFGNALMSETDNLTTAIYNCNWVDQSMKFRKCVIIFMQRSQKSNIILAGGLTTISLQTFISIIRFSFSLFTLLSQLH